MQRNIFDPCSESVKTVATVNSTKCWMLQIHILHKPGSAEIYANLILHMHSRVRV